MYSINTNTRIRELRENKKVSQKFLADLLGISRPTYSRIENEEEFTPEQLKLLAHALGVTTNYLLNGNDDGKNIFLQQPDHTNHLTIFRDFNPFTDVENNRGTPFFTDEDKNKL